MSWLTKILRPATKVTRHLRPTSPVSSLLVLATAVGVLLSSAGATVAGPISTWYLTSGEQDTNWMVQGNSAIPFAQNQPGNQGEFAIAVGNTVRTLHAGNGTQALGSEYTLGGVYTGMNFPYPNTDLSLWDGTRDASH